MDTIQRAGDLIRARMAEIETERRQLERSLAALTGKAESAKRVRQRASGAANGSTRAPRGQRRVQLLAHLEKNPGAKPSEAARALSVSANQVHGLIRKLREEKLVRKDRGGGYRLSTKAAAADTGKPRGRRKKRSAAASS